MKLVMTLVVRNEADILKANLDYHLANGVDFVIATDHGSEDQTPEILGEYKRSGVLQAIRDEEPGHHQSRRATRMVELARIEHRADWVINNDADEFWWPQAGSLRDVFAAVPERYAQVTVPRRNFRPLPNPSGSEGEQPFYERLIYRELRSPSLDSQPKVANRPLPGVVLAPGNHSLRPAGLPCLPIRGVLEVLHFPMRSYEQFERKVVQTGIGYEQLDDRSPGVGGDQLRLLELQREGLLQEHYRDLMLDQAALEPALRAGTIVADPRLRDFMRDLPSHSSRPGPGAPFATELLEDAMTALAELEDSRAALAQSRDEGKRWREQAERLEAQVDDLQARASELAERLSAASQALEAVRNSRLMRSTTWPRRVYYRAKAAARNSAAQR